MGFKSNRNLNSNVKERETVNAVSLFINKNYLALL